MTAELRSRVWTDADLAQHLPALRAAAANLCRRAWETDDLVQDACERALRHLSAGNPPPTHMRAWLVSIMRNAFVDRIRKRANTAGEPIEDPPAPPPEAEPAWAQVSTDEVRAALAKLDADLRRVFELHYLDGLSYRQVATRLKIPENTVASRLHRARKVLRDLLSREVEG